MHFIFLFLLTTIQNYECFLTNNKEIIIEALNKELYIKHLSIIIQQNFQTDSKIFQFIKRLSHERIYFSALTVTQMIDSMYDYYYTSEVAYDYALNYQYHHFIDKKNANWVYPPKTMIILHGRNLNEIIAEIFTVSKN